MQEDAVKMPAPYMLAEAGKEEMTMMSLRLKKRTSEYFGYLAKMYNTSSSALVNALLDSYVKERADQKFEEYLKPRVMASQLKSKIDEIAGLTPEEVLQETGWLDWYYSGEEEKMEDPRETWKRFEAGDAEANEVAPIYEMIEIAREGDLYLYPDLIEKIGSSRIDDEAVAMPYKKWLLFVATMKRAEEVSGNSTYTPEQLDELFEVVDNTDDADAKLFVAALVNAIIAIWTGEKVVKGESAAATAQGGDEFLEAAPVRVFKKIHGRNIFRRGEQTLKPGFRGDILQLEKAVDLTGATPVEAEIWLDGEEAPRHFSVRNWRDFAQKTLAVIAEIKPGLIARKFKVDTRNMLDPRNIPGTVYSFEANSDAVALGNLVAKMAKEAGVKKIILQLGY